MNPPPPIIITSLAVRVEGCDDDLVEPILPQSPELIAMFRRVGAMEARALAADLAGRKAMITEALELKKEIDAFVDPAPVPYFSNAEDLRRHIGYLIAYLGLEKVVTTF